MLRGPQTLGELKGRSERLHRFASLDDVAQTLDALVQRELVERLPRRPGQKEERYAQLLGGDAAAGAHDAAESPDASFAATLEERVRRLEETVDSLVAALELRARGEPPRAT